MSVCYNYIVKAQDEIALNNLLTKLESDYPIYPVDRTIDIPQTGFIDRIRSYLNKHVEPASIHQGVIYAKELGTNETLFVEGNVCLSINWSKPPSSDDMIEKGWYFINTTITSADDDHLKVARILEDVCDKVTLQSECEAGPDENTYWFLDHVDPVHD